MNRYWQQPILDVIIPLWEEERDKNKILEMYPNISWDAIKLKMSKLGIKRLSKVITLPKLRSIKLTATEKGYLAGFIDGEGCISLYPQYKKGCSQYHGRVQITNTNKEVLLAIKKMLGFGLLTHHTNDGKWKDSYVLVINKHNDIYSLLILLVPYLLVKEAQATLLLKFILSRFLSAPKWKTAATMEQKSIYQAIKQLNKKGK